MSFPVGSLVQLEGLVNAAQFNGMVAMVVDEQNPESGRWGVQLLDHGIGWERDWEKRFGGKIMAVKKANLVKRVRDSDVWRKPEIGDDSQSVWELIRGTREYATEEYCDQFCQKIWDYFFETIPGTPLTIDHGMNWRRELLSVSGHKLFYLSLGAIQHYLIVEKCGGRYRVFQCHVKVFATTGYLAGEWCDLSCLPQNKTHKKYGGGLTLGDGEMNELLDVIVELQKATKALIKPLLQHNPRVDSSSLALLTRNPTTLSPAEVEVASATLNEIAQWSTEVSDNVGPLGITTADETADPVVVYQRDQLLFKVPQKLFRKVQKINEKLTGEQYLSPVVFLRMLNQGIWWEQVKNPADGGGVGFTVRGAALDTIMSRERGLEEAAAKSARIRSMVGG